MPEQYVGIADANGDRVLVSATGALLVDGSAAGSGTTTANQGTPGVAASGWFVRVTDGTDTLQMDGDGRVTANTVAQIATTMYTEATTARTTSSQTGTQTWLANASTCWVGVNLTALSGGTTPTVTVSLQQLDGNNVWHTLASTSALNATGTAQFSVGAGMTNGAMLLAGGSYRFSWTVTGGPATCSFQIAMSGR